MAKHIRGVSVVMRAIFLCLLIIFTPGVCEALEIRTTEGRGISFVSLSGDIVPDDAQRVVSTLAGLADKHRSDDGVILLRLDSPGGLIREAMQIGELISRVKAPVVVTEKDTCASACFLLFMKSPVKLVKHGARIGVHAASDGSGAETARTTLTTVEMARFFKDAGVPNSVIGKMVTAPPGEMHYLSDSELTQMGARFMDDDNYAQVANGASPAQHAAQPAPPSPQQPPAQISASVGPNPAPAEPPPPTPEEQAEARRREELRAEQDRNFSKYWSQIAGWSKAQHSGAVASERRCNQTGCAKVIAYFDRQQRYVEAWSYDLPPRGSGAKLVCRQMQVEDKLVCTDWYDGHEFVIGYTHQIGADRVTSGGDLLDIFR